MCGSDGDAGRRKIGRRNEEKAQSRHVLYLRAAAVMAKEINKWGKKVENKRGREKMERIQDGVQYTDDHRRKRYMASEATATTPW